MKNIHNSIICMALTACFSGTVNAQNNVIKSDNIASLQIIAGNKWLSLPIIKLNGTDQINVSFDDLTHQYRRYAYKLEHCEADWTVSDGLFESDYCEGFADGNTIEDVEESINTNTLYTHYKFSIPNERCKPKISGNYRLAVYDENEGDTVFTACFMIVDPLVNVSMSVTSNTDIDTNKSHQQVGMAINYPSIRITNPSQEIKTVILQNGDWHNARCNVPSQYQTIDGMKWEHNKALIFDGGNEYHKFEILSVSNPTLGIEDTWWDGSEYHARVWTDLPRPSYTYDEDANGAFYIRNSDNIENDRASEYVIVEFRLQAPRQKGDVYINGMWTNNQYIPQYIMTYNEIDRQYEAKVKLKQGYYSYRYVVVDNDRPLPVTSEGNFFQTENTYQALVYYRGIGQRTDLLVGYKDLKFK